MGGRIDTPLLQPLPLRRVVKVLPAFRLDDPDFLIRPLNDEIRDVVRNTAVSIAVLDPKLCALAIFDEGHDVVASVEESGEIQLKVAVTDDLVEDGLFWNEIGLVLDQVGPGLAELDRVANLRCAAILNGKGIDAGLEGLDQRAAYLRLGEISNDVEVVQINGLVEQRRFHELLDFPKSTSKPPTNRRSRIIERAKNPMTF